MDKTVYSNGSTAYSIPIEFFYENGPKNLLNGPTILSLLGSSNFFLIIMFVKGSSKLLGSYLAAIAHYTNIYTSETDLGRFTPRTFHPRMVHPRTFHPRMIHHPESSPLGMFTPRIVHPPECSPPGVRPLEFFTPWIIIITSDLNV